MRENRLAFGTYEGNIEDLIKYEELTGLMIFGVNIGENFRRKARYMANGNLVETPLCIAYSTIVSRDSIRILLMTG